MRLALRLLEWSYRLLEGELLPVCRLTLRLLRLLRLLRTSLSLLRLLRLLCPFLYSRLRLHCRLGLRLRSLLLLPRPAGSTTATTLQDVRRARSAVHSEGRGPPKRMLHAPGLLHS